jgi:hypothetical protein
MFGHVIAQILGDTPEREQAIEQIAHVPNHERTIAIGELHEAFLKTENREHQFRLVRLLYVIGPVPPAKITDILFAADGEAFEFALHIVRDGLYDLDGVHDQILRIEDYLTNNKDNRGSKYEGMREAHFIFVLRIAKPIQLNPHAKFPVKPTPIAILNKPVTDLADKLGLRIDQWEEEHIVTRGFRVILPTGLWVVVKEPETYSHGPQVEVGSEDFDVDRMICDILHAFDLTYEAVSMKRLRTGDWT